MASRFSKKRVNKGRVELYDPAQDQWIPLAMVALEDRDGMDELQSEAPPDPDAGKHALSKLDAKLLMGGGLADAKPKPSRITGMMFGLIIGLALVAVLVLLLG